MKKPTIEHDYNHDTQQAARAAAATPTDDFWREVDAAFQKREAQKGKLVEPRRKRD